MKVKDVRAHFPLLKNRCYLFSGGIASISYEARAAVEHFMDELSHDPGDLYKYEPKPGAERFQVGVWNLMGLAATRPGLEIR